MWDATGFSELPPLELAISESDSSASPSLLPTPLSRDHKGGSSPTGSPHKSRPGQRRGPGEASLPDALERLLPTVTTTNSHGNQENNRGELLLPGVVARMLPTPSSFGQNGGDPHLTPGMGAHWRSGRGNLTEWAADRLFRTPQANLGSNGGGQPASKRLAGGHSPSVEDQLLELMPTPAASLGEAGHTSRSGDRKGERLLGGLVQDLATPLLPTPLTGEARHGSPNQHRSRGDTMLTGEVIRLAQGQHLGTAPTREAKLMSTPRASDGGWDGDPVTGKGKRASSAGWGLRNETRGLVVPEGQLLPTPTTRKGSGSDRAREGSPDLPATVTKLPLLPTPDASMDTGGRVPKDLGPRPSGAKKQLPLTAILAHRVSSSRRSRPAPTSTDGAPTSQDGSTPPATAAP
jgi:hypothetical protein